MSQLSKLMQVTDEEKEKILKEHNATEKDLEDLVDVLRTWFSQLDNVMEDAVVTDNQLKMALLNCKMSLEKTKRAVEGYLNCKTLYSDHFQDLIPEERFRRVIPLAKSTIMPKLLPNLCRLHVSRIEDLNGEAESGMDYYYMAMMIAEMRMCNDFSLATTLLIDLQNFTLKNFVKFTPSVNYKLLHILNSMKLRIMGIHMINIPPFYDKVSIVLKALMPTKLLGRMKIHSSLEDLYEHIPKECLPSDYGGYGRSLDEYHDMWVRELEENGDVLRRLVKLRAKEASQAPQLAMDVGMGMDGSFRKLEID